MTGGNWGRAARLLVKGHELERFGCGEARQSRAEFGRLFHACWPLAWTLGNVGGVRRCAARAQSEKHPCCLELVERQPYTHAMRTASW